MAGKHQPTVAEVGEGDCFSVHTVPSELIMKSSFGAALTLDAESMKLVKTAKAAALLAFLMDEKSIIVTWGTSLGLKDTR